MISYYDLLGMIKENNIPEKIKYNDCVYEWDGDNYYCIGDGCYIYLIEEFSESKFFEKDIEVIEPKKIEKIKMNGNEYYSEYIDSWIKKENTEAYCEYLSNKINEIIEVLNEKEKIQDNEE